MSDMSDPIEQGRADLTEEFEPFDQAGEQIIIRAPTNATSVPADIPTVTLFRASNAASIAMDLNSLLHSAQFKDANLFAVMDLKDIPRSRLDRCRQFLHVLDEQRDRVAQDAAAAIVAEEREMSAAGHKDVHSQLVHALEIARKEALQLREERRQRLIDQNRMRGEIKALQARVDQLQAAQSGASPLSDELLEIAREQMKNV